VLREKIPITQSISVASKSQLSNRRLLRATRKNGLFSQESCPYRLLHRIGMNRMTFTASSDRGGKFSCNNCTLAKVQLLANRLAIKDVSLLTDLNATVTVFTFIKVAKANR
jgi:hypothetical protein